MEGSNSQTYEQANAKKLNLTATDPIHYNAKYSYRNSPYRHLHHQNGKIGTFKVRLVESKNLKRRHWSMLGLGPIKHLGLSRAHGEVSSFATLRLHFVSRREGNDIAQSKSSDSFTVDRDDPNLAWEESESIASVVSASTSASVTASASTPASASASASVPNSSSYEIKKQDRKSIRPSKSYFSKEYRSSTIRSNSNPKWPTVQSEQNTSFFEMDLEKASMPQDGMEIFLRIQMREEVTPADSIVPVKGGSGNGILGIATVNLTPLVLRGFGSDASCDLDGVDVWDKWVELPSPQQTDKKTDTGGDDGTSQVRFLISYEPVGFSPRRGDTVALESFARQPYATSPFRPILPPLTPMRVKDIRGEHLLCLFELKIQNGDEGNNNSPNCNNNVVVREGSLRLHRNAIFVIERTNVIDCAVNVALKPSDIILSTPIGREVTQTLTPYVESAGKKRKDVLSSYHL